MEPGTIYRCAESMTYQAAIGESAMSLTNGEAGIFVSAGMKVSLTGGAGGGGAGAAATVATAHSRRSLSAREVT